MFFFCLKHCQILLEASLEKGSLIPYGLCSLHTLENPLFGRHSQLCFAFIVPNYPTEDESFSSNTQTQKD